MANVRAKREERDLAIEEYKRVLEIDPSRTEFLKSIAWHYKEMGDFDNAISYYKRYAKEHPDDPDAYHLLGLSYEVQGDYETARAYYEKALVIDPSKTAVLVELGDIHTKLAEDEKGVETFERALAMAKTPQDRARVYRSTGSYYASRGMMDKSLDQLRLLWAEWEEYLPPVSVQIEKLKDVCLFVRGGRDEEAFAEMESIREQLAPPQDGLLPWGYMCIYVELKDADRAERAVEGLEEWIETFQYEALRGWAFWGQAKVEELRGDYAEAIRLYEKNLAVNPESYSMHRDIGRCYRKLGQNEKAVESVEEILKIYPNDPRSNYEIALAHHELGNGQRATECLEKALSVWKNADPVFEPAQEARATSEEWGL
jgi:tetratricopeptide (TPR) repeat protein